MRILARPYIFRDIFAFSGEIRWRVEQCQINRSGMILIRRIERMWRCGKCYQRIHFETQINIITGCAVIWMEAQCSVFIGGYFAEKIDIGDNVTLI